MSTNAQIFARNLSASRAHLRRVGWGYGNDLRASVFDFALQHSPEHSQPRVMCAQGKMVIVGHKAEVQVLDCDQCVGVYELACFLVPEVAALVVDMLVQFRLGKLLYVYG